MATESVGGLARSPRSKPSQNVTMGEGNPPFHPFSRFAAGQSLTESRPPDAGNETADLRGKEIGGKRRIGERGRSAQSGEYDNPIHIASVPPIIALHFFGFAAGGGVA